MNLEFVHIAQKIIFSRLASYHLICPVVFVYQKSQSYKGATILSLYCHKEHIHPYVIIILLLSIHITIILFCISIMS